MSLLPSLHTRLNQARERHEEIGILLGTPEILADQNRFRELSVEYSQLGPVVETWEKWQQGRPIRGRGKKPVKKPGCRNAGSRQ